MSKMELATVDTKEMQIAPSPDALAIIINEMSDMDTFPAGRIKVASGGLTALEVTEPGEDEGDVVKAVEGVILTSSRVNAYWAAAMGSSEDKAPNCSSQDGVTGINRETGEALACATCHYNQFGTDANGRGKACKNMRQVFMLRPGDMLPLRFDVPPSGLQAFDNYRTRLMLKGKSSNAVLTRIATTKRTNKDGTDYSAPVFEVVGALPLEELPSIRQYAEAFARAAGRATITQDDVRRAPREAVGAEGFVAVDVDIDEMPF